MVTGATGNDLYMANVLQQVAGLGTKRLLQHAGVGYPAFRCGTDDPRLLMDFLEHEMAVLAFLGGVLAVFKTGNRTFHRLLVAIVNLNAITADISDIPFFQEHETVGNRQQRKLVGSDKVLADADTHHQRTAFAAYHHMVRFVSMNHCQGKGTA